MGVTGGSALKKGLYKLIFYIVCILIAVVMFLPFYWSLLTSLKPDDEIFAMPIQWFPKHLTFEHYRKAFSTVPFALFFWNSLVLAVSGVLANLFFGSLSGYAFAKLRFRLNKPVFRVLLAAMMIPGIVTMIPTVYVMRHIPFAGGNDLFGGGGNGLMNSFWGIILPGASGSFAVFFMRQFFLRSPLTCWRWPGLRAAGNLKFSCGSICRLPVRRWRP